MSKCIINRNIDDIGKAVYQHHILTYQKEEKVGFSLYIDALKVAAIMQLDRRYNRIYGEVALFKDIPLFEPDESNNQSPSLVSKNWKFSMTKKQHRQRQLG